jgi:hypothetical protein
MTAFRVVLVVFGMRYAAPILVGAGSISLASALRMPEELVYASVPSVAPAALAMCAGVILAGVMLVIPRTDAGEVIAQRNMGPLRFTLGAFLYVYCILVSTLISLTLNYWWFFAPLARGSIVTAAITLVATTFLPRIYVALVPGLYLLSCIYLSRGGDWWDVILAHPSKLNIILSFSASAVGLGVFMLRGSRTSFTEEEF